MPDDQVYDAQTNPGGVRCTLQDYMVNVFGRDERGWARRGFDNVGIQYGLKALRAGPDHAGAVRRPQREDRRRATSTSTSPPSARRPTRSRCERAYRTGAVNQANNLDQVAIIDLRGPDPGAFHDVYRTYAMRARLERNFGTAANQVLWRGQAPLIGDPSFADDAILAMDRWLARVDADRRKVPLAQKIIQDKPEHASPPAAPTARAPTCPSEVCDQTVSAYGTPRIGADGPMTDDVHEVPAQAAARATTTRSTFTDEQWAAAPAGRSRAASATTASRASTSAARSRGSPTRTSAAACLRRQAAGRAAGVAPHQVGR